MSTPEATKKRDGENYAAIYRGRGDGDFEFVAMLALDKSVFPMLSQAHENQTEALIETITDGIEAEEDEVFVLRCPDPAVPSVYDGPTKEKERVVACVNGLPKVEIMGESCTMQIAQYGNGQTAVQLWSGSGPMGRATTNEPDIVPEKNHILIKNYSENTGMAKALEASGLGVLKSDPDDDLVFIEVTHPAALKAIESLREQSKSKAARPVAGPSIS
jgi:hypothetical protein